MANIISKYIIDNEAVVSAADTTQMVEYAKTLHNTFPTCTAALGRTLTAAAIMATTLKGEDDKLTLSINGGGPAGTIMATADSHGNVKGCIGNPHVDIPAKKSGKLDVSGAVGKNGFVTVVKDIGLKEPYIGKTPIQTGEIAEDIAYYYLMSEQQPSIVYLSVWVDIDTKVIVAGGLVITPLPGASEEVLSKIENKIAQISNYGILLMSMTPDECVKKIFDDFKVEHIGDFEPEYFCDCSKERYEKILITLGQKELKDMIEEDGGAKIICRFCNKEYNFTKGELEKLLLEAAAKDKDEK